MLEQTVLVGGKAEEIALLLHPPDRSALRPVAHAVVAQFGLVLGIVSLVAHRVPAGVGAEVDLIAPRQLAPERLNPRPARLDALAPQPSIHRQAAVQLVQRGRGAGGEPPTPQPVGPQRRGRARRARQRVHAVTGCASASVACRASTQRVTHSASCLRSVRSFNAFAHDGICCRLRSTATR